MALATFHQLMHVPIRLPIVYVTSAAASPINSWRSAENISLRPVKRLVVAPIPSNTTALRLKLETKAMEPRWTKNGTTGKIAPRANSPNEDAAAVQGEPPGSLGSVPNSSRASTLDHHRQCPSR